MVRVSGLASGMDIDALVSSMMTAARVPLDTMTQKKAYAEYQRDDYRDINKAMLELDNLIFNGIGMKSSFTKKSVTVSDTNAVSVKNISSSTDFSGTIKVNNLAKSALATGKLTIESTKTELVDNIGQTITIKAMDKNGVMQTKDNAFNYTIQPGDTLEKVITKINSESNVTAFYDEASKSISFTAKNTGSAGNGDGILFESDVNGDVDFFSSVLDFENNSSFNQTAGINASLIYNGLTISRSSNTFQINGAEITLKKETSDLVTFSSTADVDAVMDTIGKFVDKYNELIEKIKGKTEETKYRSYQPLTAAQKEDMTEKQIELWETKAKSGTLRNDSILNGVLTKMRTSLYSSVSGTSAFSQLSQIGITTTKNYLEGGKLEIDKDELRAAILENPNGIFELFQKTDKSTGEGIAQRLRGNLKTAMADIMTKAGNDKSGNATFTIGKLLNNYTTRISNFETKLTALETRYFKQFTAMETAINKANSQSTSLSSYFS